MQKCFIAITSFLLLAFANASDAEPTLQAGDYLEDNFLKVLRKTQSPIEALGQEVPQSINIRKKGANLEFAGNDNWHEGYILYTLNADGKLERGEQQLDYPKPKIDSPHHFEFKAAAPGSIWKGYTYVGNADEEITRIALAGKYIDKDKHLYEFSVNHIPHENNSYPIYYGTLSGMGPNTKFYLDNDHIGGNDFDYFYLKNASKTAIAFKHKGNSLYLYPIHLTTDNPMNIGAPDFTHPLLVLQRIE